MGKIKDIINGMNNRINPDKTFKTELLKACEDGLVVFEKELWNKSTFYNVYIVVHPMKRFVGHCYHLPYCWDCGELPDNCPGDPVLDLLSVADGDWTSYYTISLDELIKHGAKEIKEDELNS